MSNFPELRRLVNKEAGTDEHPIGPDWSKHGPLCSMGCRFYRDGGYCAVIEDRTRAGCFCGPAGRRLYNLAIGNHAATVSGAEWMKRAQEAEAKLKDLNDSATAGGGAKPSSGDANRQPSQELRDTCMEIAEAMGRKGEFFDGSRPFPVQLGGWVVDELERLKEEKAKLTAERDALKERLTRHVDHFREWVTKSADVNQALHQKLGEAIGFPAADRAVVLDLNGNLADYKHRAESAESELEIAKSEAVTARALATSAETHRGIAKQMYESTESEEAAAYRDAKETR